MKFKHFLILSITALGLTACGIYSFRGTSIKPDVKTITINLFEYKALTVNPTLANDLTEALRDQFRKMTNLEQLDYDGDLEITGEITGYDVRATAITAGDMASQNRLTVSVKVNFTNMKHPEEDFSNKSFSAYSDFDATTSLDSVESTLVAEIIDTIIEDIFNATVAQW